MKPLYLIGGPMGVGKTAAGKALAALLSGSVFLDGDWCWQPEVVTPETKAMVLDNICHLLSNYLRCSAYRQVISPGSCTARPLWQKFSPACHPAGPAR